VTSELSTTDWRSGAQRITYQRCDICSGIWYFERTFCPHCGSESVVTAVASGTGTIYATTVVFRAPTDPFRAYAPYGIVLVDAIEGFRLMAHGTQDLKIGDRVRAQFREFNKSLLPLFVKEAYVNAP
jgi:uncharacterized protein